MSDDRRRGGGDPASAPLAPATGVQLVVIEDGSDGQGDAASSGSNGHSLIIAQTGGERPLEFAKRAIRSIWALQPGQRISGVSLLLAPRFDDDATEGRVCLIRALMAHSAAVAPGMSELLISAGGELHPDLQKKVRTSMEALRREPNGTALPITVRFGTAEAPAIDLPRGPLNARAVAGKFLA